MDDERADGTQAVGMMEIEKKRRVGGGMRLT